MATQTKLNKASLSLEQRNLKNYQRFLPSLELKRKKLMAERSRVNTQINELKQQGKALDDSIQNDLFMVAGANPTVIPSTARDLLAGGRSLAVLGMTVEIK